MAHNSAEKMVSDGNLCLIEPSMLGEKIAVPTAPFSFFDLSV